MTHNIPHLKDIQAPILEKCAECKQKTKHYYLSTDKDTARKLYVCTKCGKIIAK